ncbi:MAG: amidohydrolase family protein [Flavobacteriales bacterium]|nr:amidohydrolase family protein [Flavobacteriales bacterium]
MKKISANYIFTGNSAPIKNGVIATDNNGVILEVLNPENDSINWDEVEKHEGIICPGFINTHCHLELSYLKGKLTEQGQLPGFVKEIISIRDNFTIQERQEAIELAEQEMINNGIVAVGDIANGASTFAQKENSQMRYHTFLEVFSLNPETVDEVIDRTISLKKEYHNQNRISISPHAPYSMSKQLMISVNKVSGEILTIHNQETESENELFLTKSGKLYEQLSSFNEDIKKWTPTGENSLPSYLANFTADKKILLVHNTYTCKEDIDFAKNYSNNIYWCFCPNANKYIENRQPKYNLFVNEKCTIGTDSLASNWSLSILDELKTITKNNAEISLETLIKWATFNGAQLLEFNELGSIEKGKSPGLNLIKNIALDNLCLTEKSTVTPL